MTDAERSCRVFVCDDQPGIRDALSGVLDALAGFEMVGEAHDRASCISGLTETRPDMLILDVQLPGGGPGLAKEAKEIDPDLKIIVFSAVTDTHVEAAMRGAGVDEYVVKTGRLRPLREALTRAADGVGAVDASSSEITPADVTPFATGLAASLEPA